MRNAVVAAVAIFFGRPKLARANGGQVLAADQPVGPYRVTVPGSPNPLRAGRNDITVVVLRGVDQLVLDATVVVLVQARQGRQLALRFAATHANATTKQYYAANVVFPTAGQWRVTIQVSGPQGGGAVSFDVATSSSFLGMTPFELGCTGIPALAIVGIAVPAARDFVTRRPADHGDDTPSASRR